MLSKRPDGVADPSPDGSSPSERPTWRRRDVTRDAEVAEVGDDVASFNLCHFQHLSCFKSNSGSNIWILGSSVSSHLHFFARPKRIAYSHLSVRRKKRLQVARSLRMPLACAVCGVPYAFLHFPTNPRISKACSQRAA